MTKINKVTMAVMLVVTLLAMASFTHNTTMAVQKGHQVFTVDIYK